MNIHPLDESAERQARYGMLITKFKDKTLFSQPFPATCPF